jgi:hypothetical protein
VSETFSIFIAGLFGVFFGMALLYAAIKITSLVAERWGGNREHRA